MPESFHRIIAGHGQLPQTLLTLLRHAPSVFGYSLERSMLRPVLYGLLPSLLASACLAQAADVAVPAFPERGLPGKRPGTELWIVQFQKRSFDLSRFRTAIYQRRPAAEVDAIVADLERKVIADQAAFVRKVKNDYDADVLHQWWRFGRMSRSLRCWDGSAQQGAALLFAGCETVCGPELWLRAVL